MFTILWDNDGVLVDTEGLYFRANQVVLQRVGIDLTPGQFQEVSLRRGESVLTLAAGRGICREEIARLRTQRDRLYAQLLSSQSWVIDGAEETLRSLYGKVRMGVVTSSRREHFEIVHGQACLRGYLDFVLTREDYRQTKPHPEPYLTALARYNLPPQECIVIEDSKRGLTAATAAGLPCLIIRSRWTKDEVFPGACEVLESIAQVPDAITHRLSIQARSAK